MRLPHICALAALLLFPAFTFANSALDDERQLFINRFVDIAVEEMGRTGIPASIKLGQAIIESGWGQGSIADRANNFFCIKCYNGWNGPTFNEWDDEKEKSCFRKYENVIQSFIDHSDFLAGNIRYRPLFELDRTDYKAWAYGLKKCGYATNIQYAEKLIQIIESYGLWVYDYAVPMSQLSVLSTDEIEPEVEMEWLEDGSPATGFSPWETTTEPTEPTKYVSAPSVLEVPGYRKETLPDYQDRQAQSTFFGQSQNPKPRTRKIRPIMPLPNVDMERR